MGSFSLTVFHKCKTKKKESNLVVMKEDYTAQYRTGIYVDRRSIQEAEESKLSDETFSLRMIKRVNPKLPRSPEPITQTSWITDKPISTWSELHSKKRIDGCSAGSSFNRNAQFSTPIQHQLNTNTDQPHQLKI